MRLTILDNENGYEIKSDNPNTSIAMDISSAIQKLGPLEDIEEELGIDLITLFKALKQGIDMKTNKGYRHVELIGINECGVIVYEDNPDGYIVLPFDEYGKTWALTKEELEVKQ